MPPHYVQTTFLTKSLLQKIKIGYYSWGSFFFFKLYSCSKSFSDDHAQHAHYRARCLTRSWNAHRTRPKNICRDNSYSIHPLTI